VATSLVRASVRFTASFEASLETVETFLSETGQASAYDRLLDLLEGTAVHFLERFPAMGRPFMSMRSGSYEALVKTEELVERLDRLPAGSMVREYLLQDYLILYLHADDSVYLLSIRHYRQVSFEFEHLWVGQQRPVG
jgi:ParE toxin of type II toxin-antitoxin system, parDE